MKNVKATLLTAAFIAVPIAFGSWALQSKIASEKRVEISRSLTTVRDTTHLAIKTWFNHQKKDVVAWSYAPELREAALQLLALPPEKVVLQTSSAQQELRSWFRHLQQSMKFKGYFIVGPNNINLASSRDQNIGVNNLLTEQEGFLAGVWAGKPAASLTIRSDVPLTDDQGRLVNELPSMFVATPIYNKGAVVAIFMFRLDPEEGFNNLLQQGRIGTTGETYAFNKKGQLVSHSRFDEELRDIGLLAADQRAIFNIQLRDPKVNLVAGEKTDIPLEQRPLTYMAKLAIQGGSGVDLDGHRDYRGVPTVGAWLWDHELNMGISTELNADEAYQTLYTTQLSIIIFSVFTFILLIGLTIIARLLRQRKSTEHQIRIERDRAKFYLDTVDTIIVALDIHGNIQQINRKGCDLLGYTEDELIGKNWFTTCLPEDDREKIRNVFNMILSGKMKNTGYYENEIITRSGERKLIAWHNAALDEDGENPTGALSSGEDITERKKTEEALRRASTVFENTNEAIIVSNADAEIIMVNNAFTEMTGYAPDDVLGKNLLFQQSGRHDSDFYKSIWDTLEKHGQWRGELNNRRKNGDTYPAWKNINVVKNGEGEVTNYVAIFTDISVLKQSEERMAYLAHHDTLTELPNRLRFLANLEQAIESARRHKHKVALMFLDLDRFKPINDTYGHNIGDRLLKVMAERLRDCVRAEDTAARLGGDEFTVILTEITRNEDASFIADKIVKAIRKPITLGAHKIETTVSVGISIYPDDAMDYENLVKAADTAMYQAKASGKNDFQFFRKKGKKGVSKKGVSTL